MGFTESARLQIMCYIANPSVGDTRHNWSSWRRIPIPCTRIMYLVNYCTHLWWINQYHSHHQEVLIVITNVLYRYQYNYTMNRTVCCTSNVLSLASLYTTQLSVLFGTLPKPWAANDFPNQTNGQYGSKTYFTLNCVRHLPREENALHLQHV